MNSCKNFSKKYPVVLVALAFAFMFGLLKLMGFIPDGPLALGIRECIMAVIVCVVTILFMGKEKVGFKPDGLGYAFGLLRGYLIFLTVITLLGVITNIISYATGAEDSSYEPVALLNVFIAALFVGIVEEYVFRGLIFGGLLQKLGNSKKSIILAAVISGLLFGAMHILGSALAGEITDVEGIVTAIMKTLQCGIFGVVIALIYYKTRNLFVVAVVHSLDDFLLFIAAGTGGSSDSYVANDKIGLYVVAYSIFILVLVPSLVKAIKDLKAEEAIPFDDDFLPRKVEFVKKTKKNKKK